MKYIYVLVNNGIEWEDLVIYVNLQEAVDASKKYPKRRVEIFQILEDGGGYEPTYIFFQDGFLNVKNKLPEVTLDSSLSQYLN